MSNVLTFKQRPVKGLAPRPTHEPRYYCISCNGESFWLMVDKSVVCATCFRLSVNCTINDTNNR